MRESLNGIVRRLKQVFLHFGASYLLTFDGMVDTVDVTGRIIVIKIAPVDIFC